MSAEEKLPPRAWQRVATEQLEGHPKVTASGPFNEGLASIV
jgi:hypothetical protein